VKSLLVVCVLALCATAAVPALLPQGTYSQHDEGGNHMAISLFGGAFVVFDGMLFVWDGNCYTNGTSTLEFIDVLDDDYGWLLYRPGYFNTGVVSRVG
jgi:hypothetical protein